MNQRGHYGDVGTAPRPDDDVFARNFLLVVSGLGIISATLLLKDTPKAKSRRRKHTSGS